MAVGASHHPEAVVRFAGGRLRVAAVVRRAFSSGMNARMVGDRLTTAGPKIGGDLQMIREMGFEPNREE